MEWKTVYTVASLAFVVGIIFGAVAYKTNFCTMGAVSDWLNMGNKDRLRAWFLAIGVAILGAQGLQAAGYFDLGKSVYLTPNFGWLGHLLGGAIFGIGMTLGSGCGQRTLVRVGGGNLKSLVVMVMLGISGYMTMRGLLAVFRMNVIEATNINLGAYGFSSQGIPALIAGFAGLENVRLVGVVAALIIGLGFVVFAFASASFRRSFDNVLAGIVIGLCVVAGWTITGIIGFDEFEPVPFQSYTFVAPVSDNLMYLMTFTGSTITFGVAAVFGVILGAFLYTIATRQFHIETFTTRGDMIRHLLGGVFMGFGGVLAIGCTVGQGITGMSTLAFGSLLTLISIIFGSALTMKVEYYLLDEHGFLSALRCALADMKLLPAAGNGRTGAS
jgi:uncharacterized membrane protein YedE/YeeE